MFEPEAMTSSMLLLSSAVVSCSALFVYGLTPWLGSYGLIRLHRIAVFTVFPQIIVFSMIFVRSPANPTTIPAIGPLFWTFLACVSVGSLLLIAWAYRRWCVVDLD